MAKVALLIGVSDYGPGFNWLPGATKDLEAMQRILQHPDMGAFTEVKTLKNPDPLTMQAAIAALFKDKVREQDDLALFFFSGHCVNDHYNQLYFATRLTCKNPKGELVPSSAVPASFVQEIMSESCSRQQVVILDCCFSNAFANVWSDENYIPIDIEKQLGGTGRVILTASNSTQEFFIPHKGFEISTYTSYLVEGIETGAADLDRDRFVSVGELHQYISEKLQGTSAMIEPQIYTFEDSSNISLTKSHTKKLQLESNEDLTLKWETSSQPASLEMLATEENFHSDSRPIYPQMPPSRNTGLGIGIAVITVLALAGTIYGIAQWQDLQNLPISETAAAGTSYKNQAPTVFEHKNTVWSLAFTPDSQLLASSSGDRTIKLWQLKNGQLLRTFSAGNLDTVWSVAISPDGQILASGSGDNTVKIWNLKTGQLLRTLVGHTDTVRSVIISPDGQVLASGSEDKTVKIWNLKTGQLLRTLVGHTDTVRSVAITPDGQIVASGSSDNTVKIWNLNSGRLRHTLTGHTARIISIAISPDGEMIASGSNDDTIKLWNLQTGELLRTLVGHSDHINAVAFRSDGKMLVSGAEDHLIKLWNPQTGALLNTLARHNNDVYAVAISPDGKTLASGDKDGEIKLGH